MKYTIKKGRHYANFTINRLFPLVGNKVKGSVKFSKECLVEGEISGLNKLTGITSLQIHENSGRIAWKPFRKYISLFGYVYKNGVRTQKHICSVPVDKWFSYEISYTHNTWKFTVGGNTIIMAGEIGRLKIRAYPYFGGKSTAPVQMSIWV